MEKACEDIESSQTIRQLADQVVETIRRPQKLATGDAVAILVKELLRQQPAASSSVVIALLQDSGFSSADGLKDFIEALLRRHRR